MRFDRLRVRPRTGRSLVACVGILAATGESSAQVVSVRPGRYQVVAELGFVDARSGLREVKNYNCITPEQSRDLLKAFQTHLPDNASCTLSNVVKTGGTLSFDNSCRVEGGVYRGRVEVTYGADWFKSTVTMTQGGKGTVMRGSAKWVAATCQGDED